jgi:hypothetical protein
MLHAYLYTICFVFCYTSWRFYAFYRTNLLMRCHSVSSLILLYLCFRKSTQEIFSELDETKAKIPIFPDTRRSPKMRRRGTRGRPHHTMARPPWPTSWRRPSAYIFPSMGKPKSPINFSRNLCKPPPLSTRDREGPEALPSTLPERGITAGSLLHHHGHLRSDVWVVYHGLRVHSNS